MNALLRKGPAASLVGPPDRELRGMGSSAGLATSRAEQTRAGCGGWVLWADSPKAADHRQALVGPGSSGCRAASWRRVEEQVSHDRPVGKLDHAVALPRDQVRLVRRDHENPAVGDHLADSLLGHPSEVGVSH